MSLTHPSQGLANFQQQGSVDWVALGRTTLSASVSILSRISGAGLEPLTVVIAQAVSNALPIGPHGEKRLNDVMSNLKAFSSFGDVIFFGIGVRHVLRFMVQTSQGASSVALAACLAECHSSVWSAYVLYEMAKLMKSPTELTPSFAQWEKYVETCSGIFATSLFGRKFDQLARLCGFISPVSDKSYKKNTTAVDVKEMAKVLLAIGTIQTGHVENIELVGGIDCCWAAVFCEYILGLRVCVILPDGTLAYQNYSGPNVNAQVLILPTRNTVSENSISRVGRTFTLKTEVFIRSWHMNVPKSYSLVTGRLSFDSLIVDSLNGFSVFLDATNVLARDFSTLFAGCAVKVPSHSAGSRCRRPIDFLISATQCLPELQSIRGLLLEEGEQSAGLDEGSRDRWLEHAWKSILDHHRRTKHVLQQVTNCITVISLAFLLDNVVFDNDINVTQQGIYHLWQTIFSFLRKNNSSFCYMFSQILDIIDVGPGYFRDKRHKINLSRCICLFSGFPWTSPIAVNNDLDEESSDIDDDDDDHQRVTAISHCGLFFYLDIVRNLSDKYEDSSRVHVGCGHIQSSSRLYSKVIDPTIRTEIMRLRTAIWPQISRDFSLSTLGDISVDTLVEENIELCFWYRLKTHGQEFSLKPRHYLDLMRWVLFMRYEKYSISGSIRHQILGERVLSNVFDKDEEGLKAYTNVSSTDGNTLLRCILIANGDVVIERTDDLKRFIKWCAWEIEHKTFKSCESIEAFEEVLQTHIHTYRIYW